MIYQGNCAACGAIVIDVQRNEKGERMWPTPPEATNYWAYDENRNVILFCNAECSTRYVEGKNSVLEEE